MLVNIPSQSTMTELLGQSLFEVWQELENSKGIFFWRKNIHGKGGSNDYFDNRSIPHREDRSCPKITWRI